MTKLKVGVYIGRFQPLHNGHAEIIRTMLAENDFSTIIIGSSGKSLTIENPFSSKEREGLIRSFIYSADNDYVNNRLFAIVNARDILYNDAKWIEQIQLLVNKAVTTSFGWSGEYEVTLYGCDRDSSTWYLRAFPNWKLKLISTITSASGTELSATRIREVIFTESENLRFIVDNVPETTIQFIKRWINDEQSHYRRLLKEYDVIKKYKESWKVAPYAPTFVTADAVVVQSGHILVVTRGAAPGEGLWALPGGFINQNETIREAAIRELEEETRIKLSTNTLRGSIVHEKTFDHPLRSLRGRTITTAFLFRLDDTKPLPTVKGSDDAVKAEWIPLAVAREQSWKWFEDHLDIVDYMIGHL